MTASRILAANRSWGLLVCTGLIAVISASPAAAQMPDSIDLTGMIRDFHGSHPDFHVIPPGGTGHRAGNMALYLGSDERPVFQGNGFEVTSQWTNSGGQPIAPHLYVVPGGSGVVRVAEAPTIEPNATLDTWDSSKGEYGELDEYGEPNIGPAPTFEIGAFMPYIFPPAGLGPSAGDLTYRNTTISTNLHCDNLHMSGRVLISGNVTILCEGSFTLATHGDLELMPGATLDLYVGQGAIVMPHSNLNVNTGKPGLVKIYNLGMSELRLSQPLAQVYASVLSPNADMDVMPHADFYGTFVGKTLRLQPLSGFHLDVDVNVPMDACGNEIDDTAGSAGTTGTGGITSADTFSQWYDDVLGVNFSMPHTVTLDLNDTGVYEYLDDAFYPADDYLFGNEGDSHNNYFTYAIEAKFVYEACAGQFIEFRGADDAWMFVEGGLVMDLGGLVPGTEQVVNMDRLFLQDGETYTVHFFYAHRQISQSVFRMRTNIPFWSEALIETASLPCD